MGFESKGGFLYQNLKIEILGFDCLKRSKTISFLNVSDVLRHSSPRTMSYGMIVWNCNTQLDFELNTSISISQAFLDTQEWVWWNNYTNYNIWPWRQPTFLQYSPPWLAAEPYTRAYIQAWFSISEYKLALSRKCKNNRTTRTIK